MLNKLVGWVFGCTMVVSIIGCAGQLPQTQNSPVPGIQHSEEQVGDVAKTLDKTTKDIKVEAAAGMSQTPVTAKPALDPHWSKIMTDAGTQDNLVTELHRTQKDLTDTQQRAVALQKERDGLYQDKLKLQENITKELRQKYTTFSMVLFSIGLVMGGVGIWMKGNKAILGISALCGAGAIGCIFLVETVQFIPWVVGGLGGTALIVLFYSFYRKHGDLTVFQNATTQLVKTVENAKPFMTAQGRKKVFGDGSVIGIAHLIQSDKTQSVVASVRSGIETAPPVAGTVSVDHSSAATPPGPVSQPADPACADANSNGQ